MSTIKESVNVRDPAEIIGTGNGCGVLLQPLITSYIRPSGALSPNSWIKESPLTMERCESPSQFFSVQKLQRVGLSVLQDAGSWIWFPAEVTFAWSTNGRNWSSETVNNAVDRKADGGLTQELWTETLGKKARYIKVIAKNAGPCPVWHPGKGGTTWIFADEILIEAE